jgi:hypothetical protein
MRYLPLLLLMLLASCDTHSFERDKRQIIAKDEIGKQMRGFRNYSITGFSEDTLQKWTDSVIIHPIRYTLDFVYNDSIGTTHGKKALVIFTPSGNAILRTEILDRPLTGK